MNKGNSPDPAASSAVPQLLETRDAFDSVAADYDGPRGNNDLIQRMRVEMWRWLDLVFKSGDSLVDLGCGTGLDAVHLASLGYSVTATDWSPLMAQRTVDRARTSGVSERVRVLNIGAHQLESLEGSAFYDGAYSNLGPLNCVPDLTAVSRECARLLKPKGALVFTVIGRVCPWEIAHYLRMRRWKRAMLRFARNVVPVGMNNRVIWTRYYSPREFYKAFRPEFTLEHFRGICTFSPPPYLAFLQERHPRLHETLWRMDRSTAGWPVLRALGDHFLIIMRKR